MEGYIRYFPVHRMSKQTLKLQIESSEERTTKGKGKVMHRNGLTYMIQHTHKLTILDSWFSLVDGKLTTNIKPTMIDKALSENNHYLTTKIGARLYEQFSINPFRHLNKHVRPPNQKCSGPWNLQNQFHNKTIMKICQVTVVCGEGRLGSHCQPSSGSKNLCRRHGYSYSYFIYSGQYQKDLLFNPSLPRGK